MPLEQLPHKPNIVLIITDQEREVMHWPEGWAEANLPARSRLMAHGLRFSNAYCNSGTCSPSRATLLTGLYPARLHTTVWFEASQDPPRDRRLVPPTTEGNLSHHHVTLAEALQASGYATAHVGKWHLGDAAHYPCCVQ